MDNTPEIMNVLMTYTGALSALPTNVPSILGACNSIKSSLRFK